MFWDLLEFLEENLMVGMLEKNEIILVSKPTCQSIAFFYKTFTNFSSMYFIEKVYVFFDIASNHMYVGSPHIIVYEKLSSEF